MLLSSKMICQNKISFRPTLPLSNFDVTGSSTLILCGLIKEIIWFMEMFSFHVLEIELNFCVIYYNILFFLFLGNMNRWNYGQMSKPFWLAWGYDMGQWAACDHLAWKVMTDAHCSLKCTIPCHLNFWKTYGRIL